MNAQSLERLPSNAPAPALLRLKNILVPLDFSEMSLKSLQYAVPFAQQFGAGLTLVHVADAADHTLDFTYPVPLEERRLATLERELEDLRAERIPAEIPVEVMVRQDRVPDAILAAAHDTAADLIIIATHGYTGLDHLLLGSTAEKIVRLARCPVFVVREVEHDFV